MAIDTPARHIYSGDGSTRVFPIPTYIQGDDYIRIEINGVHQIDRSKWDIVNNSIIFVTAPISESTIDVQVATSVEALAELGSITNIDIVADSIADINDIASNLDEILLAYDNAIIAKEEAWRAEAERLTANSYATEPEDVFVKIYTSNNDGTFIITDTADYSSYHWERKVTTLVTIGVIDDITSSADRTYSSNKLDGIINNIEDNISTIEGNISTIEDNISTIEDNISTIDNTTVKLTGNQTIAEIKTFTSNIVGSITGNSATATKLATARTINGVAFNGSANISVGLDNQGPVINTATTLNATHKNKVLICSGTFNITLPTVGTIKSGDLFIIDNIGTGTLSLVTNGNTTDLSRLTILQGEVLILLSDGGSFYRFVSRSKDFTSNINTNGYTYLPNGLILQWGTSTGVAIANAFQLITTPIAFPTACLFACGSSQSLNSYGGAGKSGATDVAVWGNNTGVVINYIAIGH